MVIFRENTEDIYAGIEYAGGTPEAQKMLDFLAKEFPKDFKKIRFGTSDAVVDYMKLAAPEHTMENYPPTVGIGIKPVSQVGHASGSSKRRSNTRSSRSKKSVTIVHKGNIMKFTEGAFRDWGYAAAERIFGDKVYTWAQWERTKKEKGEAAANDEQKAALAAGRVLIKDAIADITLQQVLTRPTDFDVIATLNLNGDYLSDALAAQVGGIGIAPGGNINYVTGHAIFEATHGTAPKYADKDVVNPGSVVLSGEMMFRYLGWNEAADLIIKGLNGAIGSKRVTYDFARLMEGATEIKCSEFGDNIIATCSRQVARAESLHGGPRPPNLGAVEHAGIPHPFTAQDHLGGAHGAEHRDDRRCRRGDHLAHFLRARLSPADPHSLRDRGGHGLSARSRGFPDRAARHIAFARGARRVCRGDSGFPRGARLDHPGDLDPDREPRPSRARLPGQESR